jgi:predicted HAD superfamily phosphohydrolase
MGKASVKVEGGKMVNVEVKGSEVSVTGDFFIEPAEAREEIETILKESRNLSEDKMIEKVSDIDARLIGFSAEDVVEAFQKAVGDQE